MSENDELIAEAELGNQAAIFLESELGRCLVGMAQQEADRALMDLRVVDPENVKAVRDLQSKIWRAESFGSWLTELVSRGNAAMTIFKDQQRGEE